MADFKSILLGQVSHCLSRHEEITFAHQRAKVIVDVIDKQGQSGALSKGAGQIHYRDEEWLALLMTRIGEACLSKTTKAIISDEARAMSLRDSLITCIAIISDWVSDIDFDESIKGFKCAECDPPAGPIWAKVRLFDGTFDEGQIKKATSGDCLQEGKFYLEGALSVFQYITHYKECPIPPRLRQRIEDELKNPVSSMGFDLPEPMGDAKRVIDGYNEGVKAAKEAAEEYFSQTGAGRHVEIPLPGISALSARMMGLKNDSEELRAIKEKYPGAFIGKTPVSPSITVKEILETIQDSPLIPMPDLEEFNPLQFPLFPEERDEYSEKVLKASFEKLQKMGFIPDATSWEEVKSKGD